MFSRCGNSSGTFPERLGRGPRLDMAPVPSCGYEYDASPCLRARCRRLLVANGLRTHVTPSHTGRNDSGCQATTTNQ